MGHAAGTKRKHKNGTVFYVSTDSPKKVASAIELAQKVLGAEITLIPQSPTVDLYISLDNPVLELQARKDKIPILQILPNPSEYQVTELVEGLIAKDEDTMGAMIVFAYNNPWVMNILAGNAQK
jgi:hypothetical protein